MKYKNKTVAPIFFDGELTKYVVTKKGTVYNTETGKPLKLKIDKKGYYKVTISHKNIKKDKRVHVLVAQGFVKNPDPEKYTIVNHKDGDKLNPCYKNLEWTDHSGNMKHAVEHGLINFARGEKSGRAILTDKQVHEICKIMENGSMTQREISQMYDVNEQVIHEIKLGNNWIHISKKYNIQNCKNDWNVTDENVVKSICEELEKNELTLKEISEKLHVKYEIVLDILHGRNFKYISKNYDFTKYNKVTRYPKELLNEINKLIFIGKSNAEIITLLNLERCQRTNTLLFRQRKKI